MFYFWRELFTLEINTLWKQVTIKIHLFHPTRIHSREKQCFPDSPKQHMQYAVYCSKLLKHSIKDNDPPTLFSPVYSTHSQREQEHLTQTNSHIFPIASWQLILTRRDEQPVMFWVFSSESLVTYRGIFPQMMKQTQPKLCCWKTAALPSDRALPAYGSQSHPASSALLLLNRS